MTEIPEYLSDRIYNYSLKKYKGDRIAAANMRDEITSFMHTYGKHISEVHPNKATPKYCFGEWCFDTVAKAKLFKSIYPEIARLLIAPPKVPRKMYRYVEFDIVFCCYYPKESDEILYGRIIYGLIHTEMAYSFEENLKKWADRITKEKW